MNTAILIHENIVLEPIRESHREDLYFVAQDPAIWQFTGSKAYGNKFTSWFDKALQKSQAGEQMPFVVRDNLSKRILGSTRFYEINPEHARLTIGYTWYIPSVWGTKVNPTCKYLLFKYAFETLKVNRVEFCTDTRNLRSLAAIKKLGAKEEGLLCKHMILSDGYVRDSVILSVIADDWPSVKEKLEERLAS